MRVIVPTLPDRPNGPTVAIERGFAVVAERDEFVFIEVFERPPGIDWFDEFELLCCLRQNDRATLRATRVATDDDRRTFRNPRWIQSEDIPECCGKRMHFVGQIDDDEVGRQRPPDASLWWHGRAHSSEPHWLRARGFPAALRSNPCRV